MYPKINAPLIPAALALNPPRKIPINPSLSTASFTPFHKVFPKPSNGTLTPAPAYYCSCLNICTKPRMQPSTTRLTMTLPGIIFVRSSRICASAQMSPPTQNALI